MQELARNQTEQVHILATQNRGNKTVMRARGSDLVFKRGDGGGVSGLEVHVSTTWLRCVLMWNVSWVWV